ncbi:hypothetical protein ACOTJB_23825 [Achromobacter xylosoxidans]
MTTTIPAGYKLVPIEPNEAMLDAGCKQHRCEQGDPWYSSPDLGEGDCRDIYAAMLNAAPAAPGAPTVEDEREGWRIDNSAGRPILVRNNCSVIEAEDAEYVLRLIAADRARAPTFATSIFGERIGKMLDGNAPAAGDALDIGREAIDAAYAVLWPDCKAAYLVQERRRRMLRQAVDAAIAAQRKGDA